jgi:hypothetical protein
VFTLQARDKARKDAPRAPLLISVLTRAADAVYSERILLQLFTLQARDKARKDAAQFEAESLEKLSDMTKTPTSQLKFIKDAWRQVRSEAHCARQCTLLLEHMTPAPFCFGVAGGMCANAIAAARFSDTHPPRMHMRHLACTLSVGCCSALWDYAHQGGGGKCCLPAAGSAASHTLTTCLTCSYE